MPVGNPQDDTLAIPLDREGDVPIGVQLTWVLRTRILGGALTPGERLPSLHRLAKHTGVNVNTIRAVYLRLEQDQLVETRHGSGTFVAGEPRETSALAQLAETAARAAHSAGVNPRDVAVALYVGDEPSTATDDPEAARRRSLRDQIATLEQTLSELVARRPDLVTAEPPARPPRPRLLDAAGLEEQRALLLRRLATAQTALDAPPQDPAAQAAASAQSARVTPRRASARLAPRTSPSAG